MNLTLRLLTLAAAALLVACAAPAGRSSLASEPITAEMLLDASPLAQDMELEDLSQVNILEVTPQMQTFLEEHIKKDSAENTKIAQLLLAVMPNDEFALVYDDTTRTAAETFRARRGNCLSFTNMFVAMARHIGLDAYYQEVAIPPDWSSAGQALLLSQHINVFVDMQQYTDRVVDFNTRVVHFSIHDLKPNYERRPISDRRARAHYFNNIGVEHMLLRGDTLSALANLQQSIWEDNTFAPAWISLGVLHRRDGYTEFAEAAYLQALKVESTNLVAMSNLASLYADEGRTQLAEQYRARVESHRMSNPYYRYFLAKDAFTSGDYSAAIKHLKFAVRKLQDEGEFYYLLSLSYMMLDDREAAQSWMKKAAEAAGQSEERRRYQHKIDLLMSLDTR